MKYRRNLLLLLLILFFSLFVGLFMFKIINKGSYSLDNETNYTVLSAPTSNGAYYNNLNFLSGIADPSLIKYNNTYYVYSTGCNGVRISTSTNFKDWKRISDGTLKDKGVYTCFWAPEVYFYNNKYYMFYTGVNDHENVSDKSTLRDILVATADNPAGPFINSKVINTKIEYPIDATVFFDTDGKIYLYTKAEKLVDNVVRVGNSIYVEELNSDLMSVKSTEPKLVLSYDVNNNNIIDDKNYWERGTIEAPFVIKRNNTYYLMYSVGSFNQPIYTVGYATSNSPVGGFVKQTIGNGMNSTSPLLHGSFSNNGSFDSTKYMYGTGHHSIYRVNDDEMYIIYHSIVYENNAFKTRKLSVDYIGFDENMKLYVNGPTNINQPLPSGNMGLYKISSNDYSIINGTSSVSVLKDNINYNVNNTANFMGKAPLTACKTITTNSIQIILDSSKNVEDIWVFGNSDGFQNKTADVILNDKYILKGVSLGNTGSAKIQIPQINGYVKKIKINFSNNIVLSEINLYRKQETNVSMDYGEVIFIGDSYGDTPSSWIASTVSNLNLKNYVDGHYGGTGFAAINSQNYNYENLLEQSYKKVKNANNVKWIVVNGGYNDYVRTNSEIISKGESFIRKAKSYFPNAQIVIGMVAWHKTDSTIQSKITSTVLPSYKKIASDNNVLYIDDIEYVLRDKNNIFNSDNFHPNATGKKMIADATSDYLRKNTVNVVYHQNTSNTDSVTKTSIYVTGLNNQKLLKNAFSRTGYTLKGWSASSTGSVKYKTDYSVDSNFILNNNVVNLYAVWEKNSTPEVKYNITYDANGGSNGPSNVNVASGGCITITSTVPQMAGYVFKGWSLTKTVDTNSKLYVSGDQYCPNSNITLYAIWEKNNTPEVKYNITYDANGGSNGPSNVNVASGGCITITSTVPQMAGYVFKGWSLTKTVDTNSKLYVSGDQYCPNSNITLYAIWTIKNGPSSVRNIDQNPQTGMSRIIIVFPIMIIFGILTILLYRKNYN